MEDANGRLSISKGSLLAIERKAKKPMSVNDEEWDILDRKALGTIQLCLTMSVDFNISSEKTTEDLMKKLS